MRYPVLYSLVYFEVADLVSLVAVGKTLWIFPEARYRMFPGFKNAWCVLNPGLIN
jgi:hypothetical protein